LIKQFNKKFEKIQKVQYAQKNLSLVVHNNLLNLEEGLYYILDVVFNAMHEIEVQLCDGCLISSKFKKNETCWANLGAIYTNGPSIY
jgi:hypothetical protein